MNSRIKEALNLFQKGQLNESKKICLEFANIPNYKIEIKALLFLFIFFTLGTEVLF